MGLNGEPWTCHERRSVMILIRAANERSNLLALIIPLDVGAMNEADTRWMAIALLGVRAATRADFKVIYPVRKATSGRPGGLAHRDGHCINLVGSGGRWCDRSTVR